MWLFASKVCAGNDIACSGIFHSDIYIADLVVGNQPCFRRLAHYLNLSEEEIDIRVPKAIHANYGHEGSYFGHKWDSETKSETESAVVHDPHALPQINFWGYTPNKYDLALDCESLPWLQRMREAKGKLPGDGDSKLVTTELPDAGD
jgi:hypothetical protein